LENHSGCGAAVAKLCDERRKEGEKEEGNAEGVSV
jgi:hypothetical protein